MKELILELQSQNDGFVIFKKISNKIIALNKINLSSKIYNNAFF